MSDFEKYCDRKIPVRGHLGQSLKLLPFHNLPMVSYWRVIVTLQITLVSKMHRF